MTSLVNPLQNLKQSASLLQQALRSTLESLSKSYLLLLGCCFAIDAILRPYAGFQHDSLFYVASAMQDSINRWGSAPNLLPFVLVLRALSLPLGLELATFVVYVLSKLLLITSLLALARCFSSGTLFALLSLLLCSLDFSYGGYSIFHLSENFLSPRLPAAACVILALVSLIQSHSRRCFLFLLGASILHPLYGAYGFIYSTLFLAFQKRCLASALSFGCLLALGCAAMLVSSEDFGLIQLREKWFLDMTLNRSPYYFVSHFSWTTQTTLLLAFFIHILGLIQKNKYFPLWLTSLCVFTLAIVCSALSPVFPFEPFFLSQAIRITFLTAPLLLCMSLTSLPQHAELTAQPKILVVATVAFLILNDSFNAVVLALLTSLFVAWLVSKKPALSLPLIMVVTLLGYFSAQSNKFPTEKAERIADTQLLLNEIPMGSTVYWPGMLEETWLKLVAESYFSYDQMAPVIFSRKVANIARERISQVAHYEHRYAQLAREGKYYGRFLQNKLALGNLQSDSLKLSPSELCKDIELDFVILPENIGKSMTKIGDNLFVYSCG